jgi:hypothetical protein
LMPSLLPNKPAIMLANVTSRLIFNMSVPLRKNTKTSGKGRSRYDPPTLRSFNCIR